MSHHTIESVIQEHDSMIKAYSRLFANKNPQHIVEYEDYYQEACIAIAKAIDNYDPDKGEWKKYLSSVIFNELKKMAVNNNSSITVTVDLVKIATKIHNLELKGFNKEEILQQLSIREKRYWEAKNILNKESLDLVYIKEDNSQNLMIEDMFRTFGDRDRRILSMHLYGYSVKEISHYIGLGYERTRTLLNNILRQCEGMINVT